MIDSNQRMVIPEGLTVDSNFDSRYLETSGEFTYSGTNLPELRSVDNSGTVKDFTGRTVTHNNVFAISNYEFEENENDAKRRIRILQPQFLEIAVSDMNQIMKYKKSGDYISSRLKGAYNPRLSGQ